MALDFSSGGVHQYVTHATAASIDNLDDQTWIFWGYPIDISGSNKRLIYKAGGLVQTWVGNPYYGNGGLRYYRDRVTTGSDLELSTGTITVDTWQFIAFIDGDGTQPRAWRGTLSALATETGYNGRVTGDGLPTDDSGNDLNIGSRVAGGAAANNCDWIIACAWVYDTILTEARIIAQQFMPYASVDPASCVLFENYGWNGVGTQPDWSGKGNNGVVTGATVASHVPLRIARRSFMPYQIAPAGNPWYAYAQQ